GFGVGVALAGAAGPGPGDALGGRCWSADRGAEAPGARAADAGVGSIGLTSGPALDGAPALDEGVVIAGAARGPRSGVGDGGALAVSVAISGVPADVLPEPSATLRSQVHAASASAIHSGHSARTRSRAEVPSCPAVISDGSSCRGSGASATGI